MTDLDLTQVVIPVALMLLIITVFITFADNTGSQLGVDIQNNNTFNVNNSLKTASAIINLTEKEGPEDKTSFVPGIGLLFKVWNLIKSAISDVVTILQILSKSLPGGAYTVTLIVIITFGITLAGIFALMKAIFRIGVLK